MVVQQDFENGRSHRLWFRRYDRSHFFQGLTLGAEGGGGLVRGTLRYMYCNAWSILISSRLLMLIDIGGTPGPNGFSAIFDALRYPDQLASEAVEKVADLLIIKYSVSRGSVLASVIVLKHSTAFPFLSIFSLSLMTYTSVHDILKVSLKFAGSQESDSCKVS